MDASQYKDYVLVLLFMKYVSDKYRGGLKTFDYVVANFPFSNKNWTSGLDPANDLYGRFAYGIPPANAASS